MSSWRLTAAPLMSKHALWQIYGAVESPAKLSKNIFFMHFHHAQRRQARWARGFKGSALTLGCDGRVIEMRLQKDVYPERRERASALSLFRSSSNRIIYDIPTGCRANIGSGPALWEWLKPWKSSNQRGLTAFAPPSSPITLQIISFYFSQKTKTRQTISVSIFCC